ncbi:SEC-C domain-containing protein [Pseudomonas sp. efr-133-TYG-23]|uniref:SEC-C domain-containing protein n=1 Tax=Pseudomonas sp. efr-133-TYG-23 TaxID=3040309 RepID=UPI002554A402|nr:SEC-C domain-containing protein [Pseudomonas sp. efr-133-TYG-23]
MLKPIIKENSVNESERILARLATKTFFSLWSYPSLFRAVGGGKELIDLTVYFNNTLILFSDKGEVLFQEQNERKLAWSRWYRGAVQDSAKQLYAAEKFIRHSPEKIFINSKLFEKFPFDISQKNLKIHLVAVVRGIGDVAKAHFDSLMPGSSGTLGYSYGASTEELLQLPFFVGEVDRNKTFVHVLDEVGIGVLLDELNTPTDFINYLESKERAVRERNLLFSLGEEETLAYYLQEDGGFGYGDIPNLTPGGSQPFSIPEGEWSYYKRTVAYALRYKEKKKADVWGEIVKRFSDCIIEANVGEAAEQPLLTHAKAVEVLASENIHSRAFLTTALMEKYGSVPEMVRSSRVAPSLSQTGRYYIFVFFPWGSSYSDYDDYRRDRFECMVAYAFVARYKFPHASEIVVFGSSTKGNGPASETIFVIDGSVPLTPAERYEAQQIMKSEGVLDDMKIFKERKFEGSQVPARNDLCPCGSGKKYKKCCM